MSELVARLCKRLSELKSERTRYEPHWSECYRFAAPERQQSFIGDDLTDSRKTQRAELLDSTLSEATQLLVSSIISGTTPANALWFKAVPDGVDDPAELTDGEKWLDDVCQFIWRNIHGANYDSEIFDLVIDCVVAGWGVMYADIDRKAGGGYVFQTWDIGQCYLASTRQDQKVDTLYREYDMTMAALVNEYGENKVSDKVRNTYKSKPDSKVKVLWVVEPRKTGFIKDDRQLMPKERPFASYHIEVEEKVVLRETGYNEFPFMIPRFRKMSNSVYGTGQVSIALPDAKTANKLMRDTLRSAEISTLGMYAGVDDGVFNPRTVRLGGGKIIVVNNVDSLKRIDDGKGYEVGVDLLTALQAGIRKKMMADQLQPQDGPAMTATEVHVRVDLIRQQLGPLYGRWQAELLTPLLERTFGLAYRAGVIGEAPEDMQGRNLSFKFISALARSQQLEEVTAIERLMAGIASVVQVDPSILDNIDMDAVAQVTGMGLGVPTSILRTKDDIKKIREQRQQAQQQSAAQEQEQAMAQPLANAVGKGLEAELTSETRQ
ncbi:phage head-tail adapter protein [Acinetobacter haemolyticus]|uniref:portal protein n=1 Tax=Acinetobacter haemolyticus TaxID=29430 RepID=UPI00129876B6|nr:portal protein [Acinetobacter haemolyticus]MQZ32511.1 phage head-tail adapter protein [Acinetobacter haemolyticus]NAR50340.1 phage head-tail adapter protein [Acinetobacter haemolyticus]NAS08139.1 phage head-tail adapter protein [Acinetobacter haemolyticus]